MKRWNDNAAAQRHYPKPVTLASITGSTPPTSASVIYFRVPVVDARLRVKISLPFLMASGSAFQVDITTSANLWLYEADEDRITVPGRTIPLVNIEGTLAAPTAVPAANPLMGYSREFVSAADYIEGRFQILNNITLGTWALQTQYQPDSGQRFTPDEWEEIKSYAGIPTLFNGSKIVLP